MKKLITILITLCVAVTSYGQIKGIDFSSASTEFAYEVLTKYENEYMIIYPQTPVGLKHCFNKLDEILTDNNLTLDDAIKNGTLMAEGVNTSDWIDLCESFINYESELIVAWKISSWYVIIMLTHDSFGISFKNAYEN